MDVDLRSNATDESIWIDRIIKEQGDTNFGENLSLPV